MLWAFVWRELNARSKPVASYNDARWLAFDDEFPIRLIRGNSVLSKDPIMGRGQTTVNSRVATQSNVAADSPSRGVGGRTARLCVLLMKSRLLLSLSHI